MALMAQSDKDDCKAWLNVRLVSIDKPAWAAAIAAADQWFEDNAASFNSALPATARSGLTTSAKWVLAAVVLIAKAKSVVFSKGSNPLNFPD